MVAWSYPYSIASFIAMVNIYNGLPCSAKDRDWLQLQISTDQLITRISLINICFMDALSIATVSSRLPSNRKDSSTKTDLSAVLDSSFF